MYIYTCSTLVISSGTEVFRLFSTDDALLRMPEAVEYMLRVNNDFQPNGDRFKADLLRLGNSITV